MLLDTSLGLEKKVLSEEKLADRSSSLANGLV